MKKILTIMFMACFAAMNAMHQPPTFGLYNADNDPGKYFRPERVQNYSPSCSEIFQEFRADVAATFTWIWDNLPNPFSCCCGKNITDDGGEIPILTTYHHIQYPQVPHPVKYLPSSLMPTVPSLVDVDLHGYNK